WAKRVQYGAGMSRRLARTVSGHGRWTMKLRRSPARRSAWRGALRFNLVSIPVKAYPAKLKDRGQIDLDWLHRDCGRRIRYRKICPVHGEVANDEIVSAYRIGRGRYVEIQPAELERLRTKRDRALSVDVLIRPDAVDPMYYTDRTYYLVPEDSESARAYVVFQRALADKGRYGLAQGVLFKREQILLLRPVGNVLTMTVLNYHDDFQEPAQVAMLLPRVRVAPRDVSLAGAFVEAATLDDFDYAQYRDVYADKLKQLIDSKMKHEVIEQPAEEPEPAALSFTQALEQ